MIGLHPTQRKLIGLLKSNRDNPLTIREMQDDLGVSSPSVIFHHLMQLERKGYLRRNPSNPQDYQILDAAPDEKIAYINLYGLAECGKNGSLLDGNPVDRVPMATRMLGFPSMEAFMVRARGNSMIPMIKDGDVVIARKTSNPKHGSIVVCVNDGEALIKKMVVSSKENGGIMLVSLNQEKYPPFLASDDFRVEGIVKSVIAYSG